MVVHRTCFVFSSCNSYATAWSAGSHATAMPEASLLCRRGGGMRFAVSGKVLNTAGVDHGNQSTASLALDRNSKAVPDGRLRLRFGGRPEENPEPKGWKSSSAPRRRH